MKSIFLLLPIILFAAKDHATVINQIKVPKNSSSAIGLATVNSEVSFNVAPGSFHPHNKELNISSIEIQGKRLGDGSWQLFKAGKSCQGSVKIGEQLRIKGEISKKIHIFCERSRITE